MSKVTTEIELPETVTEPVAEISAEEIAEIKAELSEHVETTTEHAAEEIQEELSEEIASESDAIKEEVKSWLESALTPIAEAISTLTTGLLSLSQKVETIAEQSTPPVLPEAETITSETRTEILSSAQAESPVESAGESLAAEVEQAAEAPQKAVREILKI